MQSIFVDKLTKVCYNRCIRSSYTHAHKGAVHADMVEHSIALYRAMLAGSSPVNVQLYKNLRVV
jgi:hypothetical protein